MSWPKDPYITDAAYKTPLPSHPCERQLWRLVAQLYAHDSLHALMKAHEVPADPSAPQSPSSSPARSPRPGTARADVVERRSAFLSAAANAAGSPSPSLPLSSGAPAAAAATATAQGPPLVTTVPPATAATPSSSSMPASPFGTRAASGSWGLPGTVGVGNASLSGSTAYIRAVCARAMQPLQAQLAEFCQRRLVLGAGVVDIAVQHPLPCFRLELVRLLLAYPLWDWAMCGPVAVASGVGDAEVLQLLLEVKDLDPNTGFPLTVAVRCRQEETTLPVLLSSLRVKPNYGGAFYASVVLGNVKAMQMLGDAVGVNVNRFANNEGTSSLLYALRQYLLCRRYEVAEQGESSGQPGHYHQQQQQQRRREEEEEETTATSTTTTPVEEMGGEGTATPLLVVHADGRGRRVSEQRGRAPSTVATTALGQRDNPLFGSRSHEVAMDHGVEQKAGEGEGGADAGPFATAPAAASSFNRPARHALDITHCGAFRRDTKDHPLRTAQHWRDVLLYLFDHPAIEINAGFYMTPLQTCVMAGSAEVVEWLLQHPHLRPNRLPKATTVLCNAYYLLQHQALSQAALQAVVAAPLEMAAHLRHHDIFRLLARDQRIHVPVRLTIELERRPADAEFIPFMTMLAQCREEWEGWGWRWRRLSLVISAAAMSVFALCFWVTLLLWRRTLQSALLVFAGTYVVGSVMAVCLHLWELHAKNSAAATTAENALTGTVTTVAALVRHLSPAWSPARQMAAVVALVACPGMLPLLDVLCACCMQHVYHSRQPLQSANDELDAQSPAAGDEWETSPHSVTPIRGGASAQRAQQHHHHSNNNTGNRQRHHHTRAPYRELAGGDHHHLGEMQRLSSTASWGWSVGFSNASEFSMNSSLVDSPQVLTGGGASGIYGDGNSNESFSRPRPAAARARRQAAAQNALTAPQPQMPGSGSANPRAGASPADKAALSPPVTSRQHSFGAASSVTNGRVSGPASPSMGSRSRGAWVVPGRPSRYVLHTEYHAPDLQLRALAYTAYDVLLIVPRLLTCVVGVFMFLYMVFPTASPTPEDAALFSTATSGATTESVLAAATRGHSSFTLYYGVPAQPVFTEHNSSVHDEAARLLVETLSLTSASLPTYTAAIGFVGVCGLVASVVGGAAQMAMLFSLRDVTVYAFFSTPGDKADAKGQRRGAAGGGRAHANTDWREVRHRTREAQPDYTL